MKRPETNVKTDLSRAAPAQAGPVATLARKTRPFARNEDGGMIIFGVMIFGLMLAVGGLSFDLMRYEAHRERLQSTLDRAVLAAASLSQTLPPEQVVMDYFAKAGMAAFISESDIVVVQGTSSRKVTATARIHVPLHHGTLSIFTGEGSDSTTLIAEGNSAAAESIGKVEISMVLDVSGSMNSYNRIGNLKVAAKGFLDTVYDAAEPNTVSTSIIPYATQVNASGTLLSYFNRDDSHEFSHCINFTASHFSETAVSDHLNPILNPASTPLEQTSPFDAWTHEGSGFDLGNEPPNPVCAPIGHSDAGDRQIIPWSTNKAQLQTYIDALQADGNTSTDIGTKWGAALLDPSTQPVLSGMIGSGDVDATMAGRPFNYANSDAMKILVVMTDGAHTSQYYMNDYRSGNSFVWRSVEGGVIHYSIWWDGENSTPITEPVGDYTYCDSWSGGSCNGWTTDDNPDFWFHAYSDDGSSNTYGWRKEPYPGDAGASQMTWSQVWAEMPPEYFSDEILDAMGSMGSTEENQYEAAMKSVGSATKNSRFDAICQAAKNNGVIVFAVGLEVTSTNAARLENCASSASHYYDVSNLDIGFAFQSIAGQINQLRLTQ